MIRKISLEPLSQNCSLVIDEESKVLAIIDPGTNPKKIIREINGYKPLFIINTHGHIDHTGAVYDLREEFGIEFYMSEKDMFLLDNELFLGFKDYIGAKTPPKPDKFIKEGDIFKVGSLILEVIETPGHTPGSVIFYVEKENTIIAGDTLFKGGVGRTDLPGGSYEALKNSIKKIFNRFSLDTKVICGHYDDTTLKNEKLFNPFVNEFLNS